jgi:hypothetical protein
MLFPLVTWLTREISYTRRKGEWSEIQDVEGTKAGGVLLDHATQGRGDPAMEEMLTQPGGCHFHRDRVAPSPRPLCQPLVVAPPTVV